LKNANLWKFVIKKFSYFGHFFGAFKFALWFYIFIIFFFSYQFSNAENQRRPLLKPESVKKLWTKNSEQWKDGKKLYEYGLGWCLAPPNEWDQDEIMENGNKAKNGNEFEKRKYWWENILKITKKISIILKITKKNLKN